MREVRVVTAILGSLLVVVILFIYRLLDSAKPDTTDVSLEIAKGLINLAVAIFVSGALSFLFASLLAKRAREHAERDERVRILTTALQDFKAGFEQASLARFFLSAYPSAKTLIEQLAPLAEARARLQRVQRERFLLADKKVDKEIQNILDYVTNVGLEYREHYPYIASKASAEDADRSAVLRGEKKTVELRPLLPDSRFPGLAAFIADAEDPSSIFQKSYDYVKKWLEEELRVLETKGSSRTART